MTAGRELDALVAMKVMGLNVAYEVNGRAWIYTTNAPVDVFPCPEYSTDIAAAWEVRDKCADMTFSKRMAFTEECRRLVNEAFGDPEKYMIHHSEVILRITPEQICLAALKAVVLI